MKFLMINSVCGIGSTGRICTDIANILIDAGYECKVVYGRGKVPSNFSHAVRFNSDFSVKINALKSRIFDNEGFNAKKSTRKIVKFIREYNPDVIHLHNLHGYYINLPILFNYLKNEFKGKVLWNLYDCWPFTGHCSHFDFVQCQKWQTGCNKCAHKHRYPKAIGLSKSKRNYLRKQKLLTELDNLTIIVPSKWLDSVVAKSCLSEYPRRILPNGIDLNKFYPIVDAEKSKQGLDENKFTVLGVSSFWTETKGVEHLIRLSKDLPSDKFQVVLVGNVHETKLPNSILHIPATHNIHELCALYTVADVFVNPTLQETQGLTTVEAFACGTPAIVFNSGGAGECVDESCGIVVDKEDYEALKRAVLQVAEKQIEFNKEDCLSKAQKYDAKTLYQKFVQLYEEIVD